MSENEDLGLNEDESILLQTITIDRPKSISSTRALIILFGIVGIILFIISFFYLMPNEEYPLLYIGFFAFLYGSLIFLFLTIFLILNTYYTSKTTYYITSNRILKVRIKYFTFLKTKIYEINFNNISHLINWNNAIEIVPKKSNGEVYYKGDETDFSYKMWGLKAIVIRLNGYKGKKLITKAVDILTKEGPLRQHPNMDFLYINSYI